MTETEPTPVGKAQIGMAKGAMQAHRQAFEFDERGDLDLFGHICQALGGASVCWESMKGTGVFQDGEALHIARQLERWINANYWPKAGAFMLDNDTIEAIHDNHPDEFKDDNSLTLTHVEGDHPPTAVLRLDNIDKEH